MKRQVVPGGNGEQVYLQPGDVIRVRLPHSEVCMHMHVAGKSMRVQFFQDGDSPVAQLFSDSGLRFSSPILPGEAGIFTDSDGRLYVPARAGAIYSPTIRKPITPSAGSRRTTSKGCSTTPATNLTTVDTNHPGLIHTLGETPGGHYLYVSYKQTPAGEKYPAHARYVMPCSGEGSMATHPATADPVHLHDDPFDDLTDEALADRLEAMLARQRETTYTEPAVPITIRVPKPTIARYKARAKAAKVPYQTLINAVLARYLEEEETVVLPRINVTLDSAQLEQLRTNGIDVVLTAKTA